MRRLLQILALLLSLGLLAFLACRAQPRSKSAPNNDPPPPTGTSAHPATNLANPPADPPTAPAVDAAPEEPPEVYFPASKAGGVFIPTQQNPQ